MRLGRHLAAFSATAVALLAGIWLVCAPWVLGYQAGTGPWSTATTSDFWSGIACLVLAGVALLLYSRSLTEALYRAHVLRPKVRVVPSTPTQESVTPGSGPALGSATQNLDELLVPIAHALLQDLQKRQQADEERGVK